MRRSDKTGHFGQHSKIQGIQSLQCCIGCNLCRSIWKVICYMVEWERLVEMVICRWELGRCMEGRGEGGEFVKHITQQSGVGQISHTHTEPPNPLLNPYGTILPYRTIEHSFPNGRIKRMFNNLITQMEE